MKLKIYCEKCKGIGEIVPKVQNGKQFDYGNPYKCPSCKGLGYTELDPFAELKENITDMLKVCVEHKGTMICEENEKFIEGEEFGLSVVIDFIEEQEKEL